MRLLFGALTVLLVAVLAGLLAYQDPGYVLMARNKTSVEMSLSVFIALLIIGFVLLYFLIRIVINSWGLPARMRAWNERKHKEKARKSTNKGLIELAQGNWANAERLLLKHARYSDIPLLNYLSAARAAQKQNDPERRDEYLAMAHKNMTQAGFAVELTQAELQLVHGQLEQSLATLVHLHSIAPNHAHVLYLLARLYEMLKSWGDLKALLPSLRKHKVLSDLAFLRLEKKVHRELLTIACQKGKPEDVDGAWQHLPRHLRHDQSLVAHYARCLLLLEMHAEAEALLRDQLKRQWDQDLVYLYGLVEASDKNKQLSNAEVWLKGHENNPILLLTLGRLAMRNQFWGKARSYLEASLGIKPRADTYKELGRLTEMLNEPDKASEYYRQGLLLAAEEKVDDALMVTPASLTVIPATV